MTERVKPIRAVDLETVEWESYLWDLLPRAYKVFDGASDSREPPEIRKWVGALAPSLDRVRRGILTLREIWSLPVAPASVLDRYGADRGLPRWLEEPDEEYRRRLLAAFAWYALGGTTPGMRLVLEMLRYEDIQITERLTPERWAEFDVQVSVSRGNLLDEARVKRMVWAVNEIKAAHTRLGRLVIELPRTYPNPLHLGIVAARGGKQIVGLPRPEAAPSLLFAGAAVARLGQLRLRPIPGGYTGVGWHGAASVQAGFRRVASFDKPDLKPREIHLRLLLPMGAAVGNVALVRIGAVVAPQRFGASSGIGILRAGTVRIRQREE